MAPVSSGLGLGHDLPDIAIDAAAIGKPCRDGAHDIAMTIGEEDAAKELLRAKLPFGQQRRRHEIAGIAVGVGEGVNAAAQIVDRGRRLFLLAIM